MSPITLPLAVLVALASWQLLAAAIEATEGVAR
jgi:hypothetical protein